MFVSDWNREKFLYSLCCSYTWDVGAVIRIGGGPPGGRFNAHAALQGSFDGIQEHDR